ncbi:uncharacterized protein LOC143192544 [Rhynchophorus ferrugineus]|uniref:uncharacterized protein LOC143192544 n=1 Tax=Rhynchophorus ferrugineus TaxID=354439 RepID=UPI003FCE9AAD
MKFFIFASALLVVASASALPSLVIPTPTLLAAIPVGQHSSQYHSQDALGQYSYGYSNELSAKNEVKSADGQTVGAYSYLDPNGDVQNVQYRSDAVNGFSVSASNLPVAPSAPEAPALPQPEPVQDTPEVAEARSKHLEALRVAEEAAKINSVEVATVQVKSAVPAEAVVSSPAPVASPAVALVKTAVPSVNLVQAAPLLAAPSFSYSYGINTNGAFAVNAYSLNAQPLVAAYAAPTIITAPIIAAPAQNSAVSSSQAGPEPVQDTPEVIAARAQHIETVEAIKKDIENAQQAQAEVKESK